MDKVKTTMRFRINGLMIIVSKGGRDTSSSLTARPITMCL